MTENQKRAKQYLRHISNLPYAIKAKQLEIKKLQSAAQNIEQATNDIPESVIKLMDLCVRLNDQIESYVADYDRAGIILDNLINDENTVLEMSFMQRMTLRQIAQRLPMSETTVTRRYLSGLEHFGEVLKSEEGMS